MATNTSNMPATSTPLVKPALTDAADISVLNTNSDRIVAELTAQDSESYKLKRAPTKIASGGNLNSYTTPGSYYVASATDATNITNCPYTAGGGRLDVMQLNTADGTYLRQMYYGNGAYSIFTRLKNLSSGASWGPWDSIVQGSSLGGLSFANTTHTVFDFNNTTFRGIMFHFGSGTTSDAVYMVASDSNGNITATNVTPGATATIFDINNSANPSTLTLRNNYRTMWLIGTGTLNHSAS